MTDIKFMDNVLNKNTNNITKPIKYDKKDLNVEQKSFTSVLNNCKTENYKSDTKVETQNPKISNAEAAVEKTTDYSDEINNLLFLFEALLEGKMSVKNFMNKVKETSNGEEILNVLANSIKNFNALESGSTETINTIAASLENSPGNDLLSILNSFIAKHDNTVKLNNLDDVETYILKNLQSPKKDNTLKNNIKDAIANLINKGNNNDSSTFNDGKEDFIILPRAVVKDILNNGKEEKNVPSDVLDEKNISQSKQGITTIKIESSEASKNGKDSLKNSLNSESDEKLLNDLIGNDSGKDNKLNKVTAFMSQLNRVKDNAAVTVGDKLVVNKNNFANDIIKTVKYMEINNIKDLTVKVAPKELGEIVIKLTMESGVMKANIMASSKETANILNSSLQELNSKLNNTDIKIQNFTVDIYNGDTAFFKKESNHQQEHQQNGKNSSSDKMNLIEESADTDSIEERGNVNILA